MLKVARFEIFRVNLPFRFAFKHSLASRRFSENLIVKVTCENLAAGKFDSRFVTGFGEGIPRDYVTGETIESAVNRVKESYAPLFLERQIASPQDLLSALKSAARQVDLDGSQSGASFCALETALLDAWGKAQQVNVNSIFAGSTISQACDSLADNGIEYGAVVPFGKRRAVIAMLFFYRFYGFKTVKLKVGGEIEDDLAKVALARRIMGDNVVLRVDANCAWTPAQAIAFAERARPYSVASIEQPVPAGDIDALSLISRSIDIEIVADESLCTVSQAQQLARAKAVKGFNIRISKVGGILAAREIAALAREHAITCHMGAQVGESGLLSAAGRCFASIEPDLANCEGSNNLFLLKRDITRECLNVLPGGLGRPLIGAGLGVSVLQSRLNAMSVERLVVEGSTKVQSQIC